MGLTYNGISFAESYTERVSQGSRKDPSGTDMTFAEIRIQVRAVIHANCLPATALERPGETMARIQHMLLTPRRPLFYSGGADLLISVPNGLDDANGPFPDPAALVIQEVTPGAFIVTFAVTTCISGCPESPNSLPYLSLRWSESTSYDRYQTCTKRRSGLLVLSSRAPRAGDDLRGLVAPQLPFGFRRDESSYEISTDNLSYKFSFTDRELHKQLPERALSIRGKQLESIPLKGGLRKGTFSLAVAGNRKTDPADLLKVAIRIGMSRVFAAGVVQGPDRGRVLIGGGIGEVLDDDATAVELSLEWNMPPARVRAGGIAAIAADAIPNALGQRGQDKAAVPLFGGWVGKPFPTTPGVQRDLTPPLRGTADAVRIVAAALGDPCGLFINPPQPLTENELQANVGGVVPTISELRSVPEGDTNTLYKVQDTPGVYDHYAVQTKYRKKSGKIMLPATGQGPNGHKAAAVQFGGGVTTCAVEWSATRIGEPPEIPSDTPNDDNAVHLDSSLGLEGVELAADGVTEIYTACGVYEFGILDPKKISLAAPIPPWLDFGLTRTLAESVATLVRGDIAPPGGFAAGGSELVAGLLPDPTGGAGPQHSGVNP